MKRIIFHIDVNSAYLSWSAAHRLQLGHTLDLRKVPSVVGGNEKIDMVLSWQNQCLQKIWH